MKRSSKGNLPIYTLRAHMLKLAKSGTSWQAIGDLYGVNKGLAWKVAHTDYEPISPHLRKCLGLPLYAPCTPVNGSHIPEGTQVFMARRCINDDCQINFSPNTAKRWQCFTCNPVRKRR